MKKEKNIFLTTLSDTKNRLDVNYYMCETPVGTNIYTNGISEAEAGIKYMLSLYDIDEIVLIGSSSGMQNDTESSVTLNDVNFSGIVDYDKMSEYDYLIYRIIEFRQQIDFELLDVAEPVSAARQDDIMSLLEEFKSRHAKGIGFRELFAKLATDKAFEECFQSELLAELTEDEKRWVKYQIFYKMDSFYKMHMREENRDTILRFIPIPLENSLSIETIHSIVSQTLQDKRIQVNLYIDLQGMGIIDANTLISTFLLMNNKTGYSCRVNGLINSHMQPSMLFGKVSNMIKSYEIQKLITGLDLFLNYGKVEMLKTYWQSLGVTDPDADRLFYGMDCIDEGISLCNVDLIACGINVIRKTIKDPKTAPEDRNIYMQIMIGAIINDYGMLLSGDELSIPELLVWSLHKGLYQQTLTIIESKVPEDIVKRGIYYYARTERDVKRFMKELNFLFWNESSKMRWAFSDIEHYFIKSYGRSVLDFRQKPDMVIRDYAKLRIEALHGRADGILPAFSELQNDDLLYELLLGYYRIGNLRNQINHAIVEEPDMDADELKERKDNRDELKRELKKFIHLYRSACRKTVPVFCPVLLPPAKMKSYSRNHEIKPLAEDTDLKTTNTYTCSYNGKEVMINISLFNPDPDIDPD